MLLVKYQHYYWECGLLNSLVLLLTMIMDSDILSCFMTRRPLSRPSQQNREEDSLAKRDEDEEDNWELPEGDLPY